MDSPTAEAVWTWLGTGLTDPDVDNGGVFAEVINALSEPLAETEAVVRASDGRPGWAGALDPDTVDTKALGWLGQFVGIRVRGRLSDLQIRQRIKDRPYYRRGTVESIKAAARPWLSLGDVTIIERDGSPNRFTVRYTAAQVGAITYDQLAAAYATYDDVATSFKRYSDISGNESRMQLEVDREKPVGDIVTYDKVP